MLSVVIDSLFIVQHLVKTVAWVRRDIPKKNEDENSQKCNVRRVK